MFIEHFEVYESVAHFLRQKNCVPSLMVFFFRLRIHNSNVSVKRGKLVVGNTKKHPVPKSPYPVVLSWTILNSHKSMTLSREQWSRRPSDGICTLWVGFSLWPHNNACEGEMILIELLSRRLTFPCGNVTSATQWWTKGAREGRMAPGDM